MTMIDTRSGMTAVSDGPLTTAVTRESAPGLLLNEVERRVVKVRPMATPVDQISRMVPSRHARSMVVDYYTVDTKPSTGKMTKIDLLTGQTYDSLPCYRLTTDNDRIYAPTETLMLADVALGPDGAPLVVYVIERLDTGLKIVALNKAENPTQAIDTTMVRKTGIVRMGRAAAELDMQTDQFEALPVKSTNNCQIFKAQIEQSAFMSQARKEAGWEFSDQEEVAVMDMRLGMEKSFLFGAKCRLANPGQGDETLFTQGIWHQAAGEFKLNGAQEITHATLTSLMRTAFTGEAAGSNRKVLITGSGLIEKLSNMDAQRTISAADKVTRWGIDFHEIGSKFGTLYVVHSEVFDTCGREDDGLVLDPEYVTKYIHVPFGVEHLDLKKSGVRNVAALVITEASCLVLRHPKAHIA